MELHIITRNILKTFFLSQILKMEININQKSYKKIIGHYVRHANNQVVGILAGNVVDKKINIVEVFPLFHYALFSSSIEFVLQYLPGDIEQLGLTIVGLYFANEVCGSIPQPVVSLLENLNSHYFSSVLLNFSNYNPIDDNNSKIGVNSINKSKISSEKAKINIVILPIKLEYR